MARRFIDIDSIVNDYMQLAKEDDRIDKNISISKCRALALAALRDLQYDTLKTFKAARIQVNKSNMSIDFPSDYIKYVRIGILNNRNEFITLVENKNIPNMNQEFLLDSSNEPLLDSDGIEITSDMVISTTQPSSSFNSRYTYSQNYPDNRKGGFYGISGGGSWAGSYREDAENSRIFFSTDFPSDQEYVIVEYLADETMSNNPRITTYAYEAVLAYIYYKYIKGKSNVNRGDKLDAKREYVIEKKKALARVQSKNKAEILNQFWKANSQNAPRTGGKVYS